MVGMVRMRVLQKGYFWGFFRVSLGSLLGGRLGWDGWYDRDGQDGSGLYTTDSDPAALIRPI